MSEVRPISGQFYSYLWLREDGTPYYAGKGYGRRAFRSHWRSNHVFYPPKDKSRILIFPMLNEAEAFESEVALIDLFGRKDLGTGCLRNFTDGGDGASGYRHTPEALQKMSDLKKGKPSNQPVGYHHSDEVRKRLSAAHKGKPRLWSRHPLSEAHKRKLSEARMGKSPWNKGIPPTDKMQASLRIGPHIHWHVRRNIINPACGFCMQEQANEVAV